MFTGASWGCCSVDHGRISRRTETRSRRAVSAALIAVVLCVTFAIRVQAQSATREFNVPAQSAITGIPQFARQAGIQILVAESLVRGKETGPVVGTYTVAQGLKLLLAGTALVPVAQDERTLTLALRGATSGADPQSSPVAQPLDPQTRSSLQLAQVDQGQASGDVPVEEQDEDKPRKKELLQEVVVTGTHIRDSTNPTAPLILIDRAEIERSGYTTTQQLVDSIPQNFRGGDVGATEDGLIGSGGARFQNDNYGTGVNLRGLGPSSTLVLIDGHRLAPAGEGIFADISVIPLAAIDRVEVMTDGASAIYGADAVAGVVNFILRREYKGAETWANYGSGTDGSHSQGVIGQSFGQNWTGGSAVGTFQYQKQGQLYSTSRPYTDSAPEPTDLLPKWDQYSGLFNIRQDLGSSFDLSSDALYSRKTVDGEFTTANPITAQVNSAVTTAAVATVDFGYRPTDQWRIDATAGYSGDYTSSTFQYFPTQSYGCFAANGASTPCILDDNFKVWSGDIVAAGTLFQASGGDAKVALGASYRNEALDYVSRNWQTSFPTAFDRHVFAEFGEFELPIVGPSNAQPFVRRLDLSLAIRHDNYSDFGATTNPRYGVSWQPLDDLHIRGAYSTSFRAPNAFEDSTRTFSLLLEESFPSPSGGSAPVFEWLGSGGPPLKPEKSKNVTAGIDFEPRSVPGFKASVNYYDIIYRDRISTPSFTDAVLSQLNVYGSAITQFPNDAAAESFINTFESRGGQFFNLNPGPGGVGVRYLLFDYLQNLARVRTNGVDLALGYHFSVGGNNLAVAANATHVNEWLTSVSDAATPTNIVNTYGNPLHWRGRVQLTWSRGRWSANTSVNYSGGYIDTTTVPYGAIASWTTVDGQIAYAVPYAKSTAVSLSCTNILNRDPPYVAGNNQLGNAVGNSIHYDIANATPLGRVVILAARLAW